MSRKRPRALCSPGVCCILLVIVEVDMKKVIVAAVALLLFVGGAPVFAQSQNRETDLMFWNISLERIWTHRLGYIVEYRRPGNRIARAYIPIEWFAAGEENRAELISLPIGPSWPSMTVFFRDGQFSHVRLYVHRSPSHQTWGSVPQRYSLEDHFRDIDTLEILF